MKPVLSAWPAKKRTLWFAPLTAGVFLLSFLVIAFATQNFFLALLLPPAIAIGGAYVLLGWPDLARKDGKPFVEPRYRPYLFFVIAPLFALLLYPILGVASTQAGLQASMAVTIGLIVLSVALGVTGAYFLVGVPNVIAAARKQYEAIPPERRPFLFFPITVVFFLILYLALGVASTRLVGGLPGLLNIQVMILVPVCLAVAALAAWLLVGIPKPERGPGQYLPKVTGKYRPRLFIATSVLGGIVLTLIVGAILTSYAPLPATAVLGLALLLGFALSIGIAAAWWGTPARWRRYDDYTPGVHPRARTPIIIGISLGVGIIVAVGMGLADIDLFWGLLAGGFAAGLALTLLTGGHREIAKRKGEATLVPDLPDGMKPLILFPTWFLISTVIFAVLTYLLPGLVPVNALLALLVGLATTFLVLEQPLLQDIIEARRKDRAKRKEWNARRKERLAEAEKGAAAESDPLG